MFLAVLGLVVGTMVSHAATFYDFEMDLRDANGGILTADEVSAATTTSFGFSVAEGGTITRTTVDDSEALGTITGKTGNNHGLQSFVATVKVSGQVKITMSTCSWGGEVTVKDANNETVATFSTKKGEGGTGCYKGNGKDDENIISVKYLGDATTLTISGGGYVGYFAVEEVQAASADVSYSLGDVVCSGTILPTGGTYAVGDEYTIPANNYTLYKEGYTLTAWTDGTNNYAVGSTITLQSDLALTPVFTENTVSLADRTEPVTLKWDFQRVNGAPTISSQNGTGLWVTQAIIGNETIDVKLDFDTNNGGKLANGNWTDWCQMNGGTTLTIPNCKGATVSMEAYNVITTTTIDDQSDYTQAKTISYTVANTNETIDIVIGDGTYYRYVQTVLPVVQQSGGTTYTDEEGTIVWPLSNEELGTVASNISDGIQSATFTMGNGLTATAKTYLDESMIGYQPTTGNAGAVESVMLEYRIKAKSGVKFLPTSVSYNAVKDGTDNATYKWSYVVDGTESAITEVSKDDIVRNNNTTGTPSILHTHNITLDANCSDFSFRIYVSGFGNTKKLGIGNVIVTGELSGTVVDVESYALTVAPNEAAAGSVTKYPSSDEYDEGTEVTLTATKNFGYNFVNWTDADGNVVSTEAKFKYTVDAAAELTANFEQINTYELKIAVDGTNSYMVKINPAPTVIDEKYMYEEGTTVELTADQYDGLVTFTNWDDGTTNSTKTVSMTEDVEVTANYAETDIIAGWDFYKKGNNGRVADFHSADNESAALTLVKTGTTDTGGWLDKSTMAGGGYESFSGAALVWQTGSTDGDVGYWHWQTKVNAEAFQNINVQFQMMYNYNAYQTYNAEYSLDGETWVNFGSITMTGAKSAATFSQSLPAECNNKANLWIRMVADKTSSVEGAASKNDGNTLAMFFITGTEQLQDDGVAPVVVSTVPAEGATGASATGKIVLTFNEKVKVADEATASLNGVALTPSVSGKTITFAYKGLDYSTDYTFTLPANTVADLTDNYINQPVTINFTTMTRPAVSKQMYDAIVSNVDELLAALSAAQSRSDKNVRYRIFVKNGEYTIPLKGTMKSGADNPDGSGKFEVEECITFINTQNLSLVGESRDGVIITNGIPAEATFTGKYGLTSKYDGIGNSDVFQISGSDYYFQDLTIETGMQDATGRDLAVHDKATRTIYKNTALRGYQDTWTSNNDNGIFYFEGGYLRGRTDYMCGKGDAYFNGVELRQIAGGYAAVPSTPKSIGWVYKDCVINGETSVVDAASQTTATAESANGNYTLGRPWGSGTPVAVFIDTKMNITPSAIGWSEMSDGWPARFAEYNSLTATGNTIDLSSRKTIFANTHENNPVLTAEEAAYYADMSNMFGEWEPTLLTEQAPVVQNVAVSGNTLTWDDNDYALLYAVVKDGAVIDFTTDNEYQLTEEGVYSVRAANEMGGLNEASESVTYAALILTTTQNMAGYKSFYDADKSYTLDENTTAYVAIQKKDNLIGLRKISTVPANTPVILKTTGLKENGKADAYYQMTLTASDDELAVYTGDNLLAVTAGAGEDLNVLRLGYNSEEGVAFYKWNVEKNTTAGIVYLNLPADNASKMAFVFVEDEEADGIADVVEDVASDDAAVYNLAGQRVKKGAKGIIIKRGKKIVNK